MLGKNYGILIKKCVSGTKDIQSVISARSNFHSELKAVGI